MKIKKLDGLFSVSQLRILTSGDDGLSPGGQSVSQLKKEGSLTNPDFTAVFPENSKNLTITQGS